jgi:hypothetical protein
MTSNIKSNIKENIKRMNSIGAQIIEISTQATQPPTEDLRHRVAYQRQQKQAKNDLVGELMTLLSQSRKMKLDESDSALLNASITKLNKKLYEATSLTIL